MNFVPQLLAIFQDTISTLDTVEDSRNRVTNKRCLTIQSDQSIKNDELQPFAPQCMKNALTACMGLLYRKQDI